MALLRTGFDTSQSAQRLLIHTGNEMSCRLPRHPEGEKKGEKDGGRREGQLVTF